MPPSAPPANPLILLHPDLAPTSGARINQFITNNNNMANNSPNPMLQGAEPHLPLPPSRKVHVVYYLSRSGQLEHPHLLEVTISPNEGLYLRDVKKRLAMIRGKRLPATFAWSYKRSYKNGYVWQDLCDDDLIFPAHGCEYVLKGSEILMESNIAAAEKCRPTPPAARLGNHSGPQDDEQGLISINPKLADSNYEELAVNPTTLQISMVESGTDAATQTEEELRAPHEGQQQQQHERDSKDLSINQNLARINESSNISTGEMSRRPQNATELNKADITSPPSSSSTNSPSPYNNMARSSRSSSSGVITASDHNDSINPAVDDDKIKVNDNNGSCKTPGRSWMKRKEEQDEIIMSQNEGESSNFLMNTEAAAKMKYNSLGNALMAQESEAPPPARPSRGKHSGALSLLQFMSCGGLDIKEQILPMSLYQLRTKGAPSGHLHSMISAEHMCEVFYAGSEAYHSPKPCKIRDNYGAYDVENHYDNHHHHQLGDSVAISSSPVINMSSSAKSVPAASVHMRDSCRTPKSLRSEAGVQLQDVISIGRSSISDRSTNVSHELEYQAHAHSKMKRSGEIMNVKSSPRVSRELLSDYRNVIVDSPSSARAVSGEIMTKGSPLFVPGRPYFNPGTTNGMNIKQSSTLMHSNATIVDPQMKPSSTTTSRAFSEGELSSMLAKLSPNKHSFISKSGEKSANGYDQSMAQIWEELLQAPAKDELKEGDYQRRQIMANLELDRERTLQHAVDLSLPPVELLVLQECPHCCRKVKPELLKSHMKNCSSNNKCNNLSSNNNSSNSFLGKPPKPDSSSNLCQRFLRASPPSTK